MQPLDIGVCLKKSTVALESIGPLCQAVIGNTHTGIATFRIRPPGSGILAHFLAGTDMCAGRSDVAIEMDLQEYRNAGPRTQVSGIRGQQYQSRQIAQEAGLQSAGEP